MQHLPILDSQLFFLHKVTVIVVTRLLVLAVVCGISISVQAQRADKKEPKTIWEKVYPPNGYFLYDSIYIDETEIANIHYLEYLHYLSEDSTETFYQSQLPDSSCWQDRLTSKVAFPNEYFRYPGYRYFPVIGVTYEQAVNYCKWRSVAVTGYYTKTEDYKKRLKKYPELAEYDIEIEYRLPTKEEWEYAACGGLDKSKYPYGMQLPNDRHHTFKIAKNYFCSKCLDAKGIQYSKSDVINRAPFNVFEDYYYDLKQPGISCMNDSTIVLDYVYQNRSNEFVLFNMIGNISEMTATKGVAKGGSFKDYLSDVTIATDFNYEKPEPWLGFRCVAIVHMRRKKTVEQNKIK